MRILQAMDNKKLKQIINDISINSSFTSCNYTVKQKIIMCQAFLNILDKFPEEMSEYLIKGTRGSSLQNKIFKCYLELLEQSLPFSYVKGNKKYIIDSITDKNLNIFTGLEEFEQYINSQHKIKNNTSNIYIGGRKASYVKPYFIGKLLDVVNIENNCSLLSHVDDYTFSYIKMSKIVPGTKVKVIHLGVPPHYQMGPMVYLNRIRVQIKNLI